ncbi:NRDE family protein [Salibacterium sp. K-3]
MCLIGIGFRIHPEYPLIVAANRDEFYDRPAAPLHSWYDSPIIAGKDLKQRGTWMGVTKAGRFAAVTNVRDPGETNAPWSRGTIVKDFLETGDTEGFFKELRKNRHWYGGYNLIGGDRNGLYYATNQTDDEKRFLPSGIYGLSNAYLETPWPKVKKIKSSFSRLMLGPDSRISTDSLFDVLSDSEEAGEDQLPDTGIGLSLEKKLSPLFINMEGYGTRSQTVFMLSNQGSVVIEEKTFRENSEVAARSTFYWDHRVTET